MPKRQPDKNTLLVLFPLWMLINPEHPTRGLLKANGPKGESGCPIFTDRDLAERYRDSIPPIAHYVCGLLENRTQLNSLLDTLESLGVTHVAIDSTNKGGRFNPLGEIREAINREARDN